MTANHQPRAGGAGYGLSLASLAKPLAAQPTVTEQALSERGRELRRFGRWSQFWSHTKTLIVTAGKPSFTPVPVERARGERCRCSEGSDCTRCNAERCRFRSPRSMDSGLGLLQATPDRQCNGGHGLHQPVKRGFQLLCTVTLAHSSRSLTMNVTQ